MNNIIIKTDRIFTAGCGKGQKCSVGLYVLPMAATKEITVEYTKKRIERYKEDYNK